MWTLSLIADEIFYIESCDSHWETVKVKSFPMRHFLSYCRKVIAKAIEYNIDYTLDIDTISIFNATEVSEVDTADIFAGWMDINYFKDNIRILTALYPDDEKLKLDIEKIWYEIC